MAIRLNPLIPVFTTIEEYDITPWIRRFVFPKTCLLLSPYQDNTSVVWVSSRLCMQTIKAKIILRIRAV